MHQLRSISTIKCRSEAMILRLLMSFLDTERNKLHVWANWEKLIGNRDKAARIYRVAERMKQRKGS